MSKSRSVSKSVNGSTISIDASYAQELVEFWTGKYEEVKEELNQIKVRGSQCSSNGHWFVSSTADAVFTRKPPLLLRHHLQVVPATATRGGGADPAPPRSSESRITSLRFPTPKATHSPV